MRVLLTALMFLVLCIDCSADANQYKLDSFVTEIAEGMTYDEVIKKWGPPKDKIEQEAKRVDIWIYDDSRARFFDGKLVAVEKTDGLVPENQKTDASTSKSSKDNKDSIVIEDILHEIMDSSSE